MDNLSQNLYKGHGIFPITVSPYVNKKIELTPTQEHNLSVLQKKLSEDKELLQNLMKMKNGGKKLNG